MARSLTTTPSSGTDEVFHALYLARGHDGNHVDPLRLLRFLPSHTDLDEVQDVLEGASGTYVSASSSLYALTAAGVAFSRANRPRHSRIGMQ